MDGALSPGLVMDVRVGESVVLHPDDPARRAVVTVEAKSGQRVRLRVQAREPVQTQRFSGHLQK